jgi:hypothetical protein
MLGEKIRLIKELDPSVFALVKSEIGLILILIRMAGDV